jgi:hypothetical protein
MPNSDMLSVWRHYATDVRGISLPCDRYLPEEQADLMATSLREIFRARSEQETPIECRLA